MIWHRCPVCGKELPETMYSLDSETGKKHSMCKRCLNNYRSHVWHQRYDGNRDAVPYDRGNRKNRTWRHILAENNPHPGSQAVWTEDDKRHIEASVGRKAADVAREIGRSENAVKSFIWEHCKQLHLSHGVIEEREAVEASISA